MRISWVAGLAAVLPLAATLVGTGPATGSSGQVAHRATAAVSPRDPGGLAVVGDRLFFGARSTSSSAWALWSSDGTRAGTQPIKTVTDSQLAPCCAAMTAVGDRLFFGVPTGFGAADVWLSDGTRAGTHALGDGTGPTMADMTWHAALGGQAYFSGTDGGGAQLWRSDLTPAGTQPVPAAGGGSLTTPTSPTVVGDQLMVAAGDPGHRGVWVSDGTTAGATEIAHQDRFWSPFAFTPVGGRSALFLAQVDVDGPASELWRTDGTSAGTAPVTGTTFVTPVLQPRTAALPGRMVFAAASGDPHVLQLWVSDGTETGTRVLRTSTMARYSTPGEMLEAGDRVYVVARGADQRRELWRTDGTPAGTVRVTHISRGTAYDIKNLTRVGRWIYFTTGVDDSKRIGSGSPPAAPDQLWRTDGTRAGTERVGTLTWAAVSESIGFRGRLWFVAQRTEDGPVRLWRSDGTASGTRLVASRQGAGR